MIEEELDALLQKPRWKRTFQKSDARANIINLAKLRIAWLQVLAESDPSRFQYLDSQVLVRRTAEQTNAALGWLSLGIKDHKWMQLDEAELQQIQTLIPKVAKRSVENRSRNAICTARMNSSRPPRGIYQTPVDAYRYTEFFQDKDVSVRVLAPDVKGASGRPPLVGIMESLSLEFAEFEESQRQIQKRARESSALAAKAQQSKPRRRP
jgi:hypothetical protein